MDFWNKVLLLLQDLGFTPVIWHWFCPDKKIWPILFFLWLYIRRQRLSLFNLSQLCVLYLSVCFFLFVYLSSFSFWLFIFCLFLFYLTFFNLFFLLSFCLLFVNLLSSFLFFFFSILSFFFIFLFFYFSFCMFFFLCVCPFVFCPFSEIVISRHLWSAVSLLLWLELDLEECPILFLFQGEKCI